MSIRKTKMETPKPTAFPLIIDEERSALLNFMFNVCDDEGQKFREFLKSRDLLETFDSFTDDAGEKRHELGWCKDPTCTYNEDKK